MADWRQLTLDGIPARRGNDMGDVFERHLDSLHDYYRDRGLINVYKNAEKWTFKYGKADNFEARWKAKADTVAKTPNGKRLLKVMSLPDYSGGNGSFSIMFDAKTTTGEKLPMDKLTGHQIGRLKQAAHCRQTAGFLIWFYEVDRVFFAPIQFVLQKEEIWHKNKGTRAKPAPAGTASITIAELETHGKEITKSRSNASWDWFLVLCQPGFFK